MALTQHPNALVGGASGAAGGSLVIAILGWAGVSVSAYEAGLIFAAVSSLVLFIGKNGIAGLVDTVLHGKKGPPADSSTPA